MNAIRQIQTLNKRELENAVPPEASWHADYRDTAYIYIGSLPYDISEGDLLTVFSQFGEPVHLNLVRDKETGKSKGFAFLKYEDQRSTDLAVDNLTGATVLGRMIRVDHVRYKRRDDEGLEDNLATLNRTEDVKHGDVDDGDRRAIRKRRSRSGSDTEDERRRRPLLKEEKELAQLMEEHDEEDPMKEYIIQEKKEEVARAVERYKKHRRRDNGTDRREKPRHRHRHHRRHIEDRSRSQERRRPRTERHTSRSRSRSRERSDRRHRRDRRDSTR